MSLFYKIKKWREREDKMEEGTDSICEAAGGVKLGHNWIWENYDLLPLWNREADVETFHLKKNKKTLHFKK